MYKCAGVGMGVGMRMTVDVVMVYSLWLMVDGLRLMN